MDIKLIEKNLGTENLRSYLEEQINLGINEAEKEIDTEIAKILEDINNDSSDIGAKSSAIIMSLVSLKKNINHNEISFFNFFVQKYKSYNTYNIFLPKKENINQVSDLIDFIIEYYDFIKMHDFSVIAQLKKIKVYSKSYYLDYFIKIKSVCLFEKLNDLNYLTSFNWNITSLESGIIIFYDKFLFEKDKIISELIDDIISYNKKYTVEVDNLKEDIQVLEKELIYKNNELNEEKNYIKTYITSYPTILVETFFGDNQPFILNLFNFLKTHKIMGKHGWSHFFSCLTFHNTEIIYLESKNNSKFIGRIFFNLINGFLQVPHNDEAFLRRKFYIDEKPIGKHFFSNHMKKNSKKEDDPSYETIDNFFENQKKIFYISK